MLKIQSTKKNEKGVALIFTLLMLSLLLIMAMGFVLDSMFSQKSAYNAANTSAARFLAEVQLKQVLNLIKNNRMNAAEGYIYSKDLTYGTPSPPPPVEDYDMLQEQTLFPSRLRVDDVLDKYNNIECLTTSPPKVNWNYIKDNSSGPQNIIGRTAFVVIPDKVPLDSLVDDRTLTAGTATATYPQHNEKNDTETRIGKYVSEINVRAAIPAGMTNISTITEKLNWTTVTSGLYNGTNWKNFLALFTALPDIIPNEKAVFASKLSLAVTDDKEAFWADSKPNTKIDNGELYKRFDLTRDWTTTANTWDTSRDL